MITILTCTHNRKSYLDRLKSSLEAQSVKKFEWLIVDDGSTDGTSDVVENWGGDAFV